MFKSVWSKLNYQIRNSFITKCDTINNNNENNNENNNDNNFDLDDEVRFNFNFIQ